MDSEAIRHALGLGEGFRAWIGELAALGPAPGGVRLPAPDELPALLDWLAVAPAERPELVANRPDPERYPVHWWLLERAYHQALAGLGGTGPPPHWPAPRADDRPVDRYVYPWLYLALLPAVRAHHTERGVPEAISRASLADLGRQLDDCRAGSGRGGMLTPGWLTLAFRGSLYELGRLQYQRVAPPRLELHIPATGPLVPELVDESLARAREFFARYYPEERYTTIGCESWLLDDQWLRYLPESSNILAFQRRFTIEPLDPDPNPNPDPVREPGTDRPLEVRAVVELAFRRPRSMPLRDQDLDELPRDTTLHRAMIDHLRAGGEWRWRAGTFPFQ